MKKTSEIFFNFKNELSHEEKALKIFQNEIYLNKFFNFFLSNNELENLKKITHHFNNEFVDVWEKDRCHKANDRKKAFEDLKLINETINSINPDSEDMFYLVLCLYTYFSLRIMEIKALEIGLKFSEDGDNKTNQFAWERYLTNFENENSMYFQSTYSRNDICEIINKYITDWLLVYCSTYKLNLQIKNLNFITTYFLLSLEASTLIQVQSNDVKIKDKNYVHGVKYSFTFKTSPFNNIDYPLFFINIGLTEPIIITNEFFHSENTHSGQPFVVADNLFIWTPLLKKNPRYGNLENFNEEIINEKTGNLENVIKQVKKTLKIDFNNSDKHLFKETVFKECSTKLEIDKNKFYEAIKIFKKIHLFNIDVDLEKPNDQILPLLASFKYSNSNKNKNFLNNLIIFIYLIFFKKNFIDNSINNNLNQIYLVFTYDFRGRKYYDSSVAITSFKLSRFYLHYGYYSSEELDILVKKSLKTKAIKIIEPLFKKLEEIKGINEDYFKDNDQNRLIYKKAMAVNHFIGIGVIFKNNVLMDKNLCEDGYTLSTSSLFEQGKIEFSKYLSNKEEYFENFEIEDELKLLNLFDKILKGMDFFKKETIGLDFSCSGHQIRYSFNGFKNISNYKYVNIGGEDKAVDMYSFILVKFRDYIKTQYFNVQNLEKNQINDEFLNKTIEDNSLDLLKCFQTWEELDKFLIEFYDNKRNLWKNSIMVVEYNAVLKTFKDYCFNKLKKKKGNFFVENILSNEKQKQRHDLLMKLLYEFSGNLNKYIKNFDAEKSDDIITKLIKTNNYIVKLWDGFEIVFGVFDKSKADHRVNYKTKDKQIRKTSKISLYSNYLDEGGTQISLAPNFIHSLDGAIIRAAVYYSQNKSGYLTIHDEFWIPDQEVFLFKDHINKIFKLDFLVNLENQEKIRSIIKNKNKIELENHPVYNNKIKNLYCYFIIF